MRHLTTAQIPVGQSRSFTLISALPSQPGIYQLRVSPIMGTRGSGAEVEIKIKGDKRIPAAAMKPVTQPGALTSGAGNKATPKLKRVPATPKKENGNGQEGMMRVPAQKAVPQR
ncbi:MAG: hypothetical protein JRH01_19455 [Deltaproteobacteria bacterium]|nr:hypothetical protein [Deltaproteobacteria bacterium]MBW2395527.1 hypothetical protein [Deltaproteobacteria bacterium]